jgi:FMN reductase
MQLVAISGSPSTRSRSAWLLQLTLTRLESVMHEASTIMLRDLPPQALLAADAQQTAIHAAVQALARADVVLVATPIYKAAYSGLLKTFLDLLPADAMRSKTVLPLATGGSAAHMLALDYALKPVLYALGARAILDSVFAADAQLAAHEAGGFVPDASLLRRLDRALQPLLARIALPEPALRCSA